MGNSDALAHRLFTQEEPCEVRATYLERNLASWVLSRISGVKDQISTALDPTYTVMLPRVLLLVPPQR